MKLDFRKYFAAHFSNCRFFHLKKIELCFFICVYLLPVRKSCEAPVRYSNRMHQAGVYEVHGVWCDNVLCAPVLSLVELR